jgi:glycosyltransferase involved in cell wall biosynthesis
MRLGVDLLGAQSPSSRGRGIGRYVADLVDALAESAARLHHELVVYYHSSLPTAGLDSLIGLHGRCVVIDRTRGDRTTDDAVNRLLRVNPHGLDALLIPSPFEADAGAETPTPCRDGVPTAAILYDLIPLAMPEHYEKAPFYAIYRRLVWRLARYDRLLAISEWTRLEAIELLGLAPERVTTIGTAARAGAFFPADGPVNERQRARLEQLGIRPPYFYCVGGDDRRKNLAGLLEAFAHCDAAVRSTHQLVITCRISDETRRTLGDQASKLGIHERLVLTGELEEPDMLLCHQHAVLFVFPSLAEGFGLPVLEAMHCGTPVVSSNRTSLPEVVGNAGILVDPSDARSFGRAMSALALDPTRLEALGLRARERADSFQWSRVAGRVWESMERLVRERRPRIARPPRRSRVAVVSPLPPTASGVAVYGRRLALALGENVDVELFHEPGSPSPADCQRFSGVYEARALPALARVRDYDVIHYQLGNSLAHVQAYEQLQELPGIVTLHDVSLVEFLLAYGHSSGQGARLVQTELSQLAGTRRSLGKLGRLARNTNKLTQVPGCLCYTAISAALAVIVHSQCARERIEAGYPELAAKVRVIPHGADVCADPAAARRRGREALGFVENDVVLVAPGQLQREKYGVELVHAFRSIADEFPTAQLVFAGREDDGGEARRKAEAAGLSQRVRFTGALTPSAYEDWVAAADLGLGLRRPPTRGETSGAVLDLLAHGIPTVVTRTGWFAELPRDVVQTIDTGDRLIPELIESLQRLLRTPGLRHELGERGMDRVRRELDWRQIAEHHVALYRELAPASRQQRAVS